MGITFLDLAMILLQFEGTSESMDKFRAWAMDPANRTRGGAPPPMRPSLAFDGTTTNREMFKGWQLPARRPALGIQVRGSQKNNVVQF